MAVEYEPVGAHPRGRLLERLRAGLATRRGGLLAAAVALVLLVLDVANVSGTHVVNNIAAAVGVFRCSKWEPPTRPVGALRRGKLGSAVAWEGDAAFWRMFPCPREEYRVVLASNASAMGECGATVVTAWFDIGRSSWSAYARPTSEYLANMRLVMTVRNPMVIFTTEEFTDAILDMRAAHGLLDRTTLVTLPSLRCSPVAHLEPEARGVMCAADYLRGLAHPETPERTQVWYNLIMWSKAYFFKAASLLPQTANGYYIWLDAGCHFPMCQEPMRGTCVFPRPHAQLDKLRVAQNKLITPAQWAMDPVAYVKASLVHFIGTIWGTSAANVPRVFALFTETLRYMISQGAVDQDQAVIAHMYKRDPAAFDSFYTVGEWNTVLRDF